LHAPSRAGSNLGNRHKGAPVDDNTATLSSATPSRTPGASFGRRWITGTPLVPEPEPSARASSAAGFRPPLHVPATGEQLYELLSIPSISHAPHPSPLMPRSSAICLPRANARRSTASHHQKFGHLRVFLSPVRTYPCVLTPPLSVLLPICTPRSPIASNFGRLGAPVRPFVPGAYLCPSVLDRR
jgi:hypothetical protein